MSRSLNLSNSELIEKSVANNESELTHTGALLALTGNRTGRSPKDRYIAVSYTHLTLPTNDQV